MTRAQWSTRLAIALALSLVAADATQAAQGGSASAEMKGRDGKTLGRIELIETTAGVLMRIKLAGLPPGPHGFHAYEVGKCDGDFSSAGAIFNPLGAKHGFLSEEGPMAGDLPNLIVPANGALEVELLGPFLTLGTGDDQLLDADGAALIIREKADDHLTDPDGGSGDRIACGVIVPAR